MKTGAKTARNGPPPLDSGSNPGLAAIALLGRLDKPTDGVRDYCSLLSQAFLRRGDRLDLAELRWEDQGWVKSLWQLWRDSRGWTGRWVLFQYTALMWSRKGFPVGALAVLGILRLRGTKLCIVFHDISNDSRSGMKQRIRVAFQYWTMRTALRWATRSVLTVPLKQVPWLPRNTQKAVFIPVGANFPEIDHKIENAAASLPLAPTVAVFGITGGATGAEEIEDIVYAVKQAKSKVARLRVMIIGRGSAEREGILRKRLDGSEIELQVLGLLPAEEIRKTLAGASAMLCVRGYISTRRGNAIAGIVCGLPVAGYSGSETGFPITEAGLLLYDKRDRDGLADGLCRILTDDKLRGELRIRSLTAAQKYFSWDSIAAQFHAFLVNSGEFQRE
jgi:glycosyltransferase involved in cell wall biosynthesis